MSEKVGLSRWRSRGHEVLALSTLRVLSYNIFEGGEGRLPQLASVIRSARPQVVALLEAIRRVNVEELARKLEMELSFGEANNGLHLAWLSSLPVRHVENHRLPILAKTLLEIEIDRSGTGLRLFATHLASRHDSVAPVQEVVAILELLRPLADEPHLLVGDFNSLHPDDPEGTPPPGVEPRGEAVEGAPRSAIRLLLEAGYVDCYRALHPFSPGYTYPSDHPWLRLDYIFASPPMAERLIACDIAQGEEAERSSDHLPVWGEFR